MLKTKEALEKLTCKDLIAECKKKGLSVYNGKNRKTKPELISLLMNYAAEHSEETDVTAPEIKRELKQITKSKEGDPWIMGNKDAIIENAELGVMVAFLDSRGKPRTGKLEEIRKEAHEVVLVTEYGWSFTVPYRDVLWVLNYGKWPRVIYKMLKEYKNGCPISIVYQE